MANCLVFSVKFIFCPIVHPIKISVSITFLVVDIPHSPDPTGYLGEFKYPHNIIN